MIDRKVLALWLATALLVAVASGAVTVAVLSDEETVSVSVTAATNAEPIPDTSTSNDGTGDEPETNDPVALVDSGNGDLRARTVAKHRYA